MEGNTFIRERGPYNGNDYRVNVFMFIGWSLRRGERRQKGKMMLDAGSAVWYDICTNRGWLAQWQSK